MDRIHPSELDGIIQNEGFGETEENLQEQLKAAINQLQTERDNSVVIDIFNPPNSKNIPSQLSSLPPPLSNPRLPPFRKPPRIVVTQYPQTFESHPLHSFESLGNISRFIMTYTGQSTAKIITPSDVVLFKCHFPRNTYWEGCHPEMMEKVTEICEYRNSNIVMQLRHVTPPCQSCFEEEMNTIEILGSEEDLMATIVQKKTWLGSRISREILIEPGPYGKSETFTATFTWNDASINFKSNRSGVIVATLMTDCKEKGNENSYVLQFLRDIRPRDKAILVALMVSRDTLLVDESQTKEVAERMSMALVILGLIAMLTYFFLPSKIR